MTHINAYYGNVEEKKQALAQAKDELAAAEQALKDHPDYEEPKAEKKAEGKPKEESKEDSKVEVKKK